MKIKLALLCLLLCAGKTFSQSEGQYERGDLLVNAGLSFGLIGYGYGFYTGASGFVPVFANVEYSLNDVFSIGPYLGFYSRSYSAGLYKFSAFTVGARGTFHASQFLNDKLGASINAAKLDLYASLHLGVESVSWKYENTTGFYPNSSRFIFGPVLGVRYYFAPRFGGFLETGRGAFGWATLGVTIRV